MALLDQLERPLRDLRVSVTDRCNLRCTYCMPREVYGRDYQFLPKEELLTFEEIERIVRMFASLGVEKIRLTGGEPLLRRGLDRLIAKIGSVAGIQDITLTTNGTLLSAQAQALRSAGLHRITVSLDALEDSVFTRMSDAGATVAEVLGGIESAAACGFNPVKINAVIRRGINEDSILPLARRFARPGFILRFIEFMDVGATNRWRMDEVVTGREVLGILGREFPLSPLEPTRPGEVARRYACAEGEIGVITSVSAPFCGDCGRARLTSDGKLFTCLFGTQGFDVKRLIRTGQPDSAILDAVRKVWRTRADRYSELRSAATMPSAARRVEMSRIGG